MRITRDSSNVMPITRDSSNEIRITRDSSDVMRITIYSYKATSSVVVVNKRC